VLDIFELFEDNIVGRSFIAGEFGVP